MEQMTIRLQKSDMIKIERLSKKLGLKKSDITRMAIKKFLENSTGPEKAPFESARHLIGVAHSGIPDLGANHRRHLVDKIKSANQEK